MRTPWTQVNITYPGFDRQQREHHAVDHLARAFATADAERLVASWFFIRKGPWRIRYRIADGADHDPTTGADPLFPLLTDGFDWHGDIYEPEVHAFGGTAGMDAAHALFHHDSRHLIAFLSNDATDDRRERSLVLCTALMRAAGLDFNEQGDVWAKVAEQRPDPTGTSPDPPVWRTFTGDIRHLLLGEARADLIGDEWLAAFKGAGETLRSLREGGLLDRGIRAIIALHVIFHWNRLGLPAATQARLARAAKEAVFDTASTDRAKLPAQAITRRLTESAASPL
ncbi:thiopeptide-type bacteriocin biosynthesis protein [Murinocardiopsis flavida]|uniref:Thiopeptide-type bacteriocin biosynthesis protein n=1 Tax=Murinocardiopsis flavida TaxID=645275 RepID=A0A2P8DG67_9ACTN|nr:thiopeptide-type bacteriocin biosynthesis protein [Murinocardiopsis flavida]PSK96189.1 thiopeptide-type bacteriocin biosynthesis protein [Murinocardiopsis flavida]